MDDNDFLMLCSAIVPTFVDTEVSDDSSENLCSLIADS